MRKVFALAAIVLILGIGARTVWLEPASLRNETYQLTLPSWPAACDGLRVAVLSDLHVGSPFNGLTKLERIVDVALGARPDMIVLTGDYVIQGVPGGTFVAPRDFAPVLRRLRAPMGVFGVLGNHDHWLNAVEVRQALEQAGVIVLEDRASLASNGACRFWVAGVSDFWEGDHDIARALQGVTRDDATLLITHNPDLFPDVPDRVTLTVAGHTHGGQVRIPWIGRPIVPSTYGERYAAGHIVEGGRHLFVSTGLGTSMLPVRLLVPPEVSILILESGRGSER